MVGLDCGACWFEKDGYIATSEDEVVRKQVVYLKEDVEKLFRQFKEIYVNGRTKEEVEKQGERLLEKIFMGEIKVEC